MVKISSFIVGLIIFSLTSAVFGTFWAGLNNEYPQDYNSTTFENLNQLSNLTGDGGLAEDTKEETENIKEKTGVLDVIGNYFSSAAKALKLTAKSVDTFDDMTEEVAKKSGITGIGVFKEALMGAVIILLFIGVIISAMVKKDV